MSDTGFRPGPTNPNLDRRPNIPKTDTNRDPWDQPLANQDDHQQRTTQQQNPKANVDDNTGIDDTDIDNIWDDIKKKKTGDDDVQPNNQPLQQAPEPQKQLNDYLDSVGLNQLTLTDAEKEGMKNGEFEGVLGKMNDKIRQAHIKAMSGAKVMIDAAVEAGVAKALAGANSTFSGQMNKRALNEALPFTKDKAIGPVAETVMQKFLDRGLSTEDAIDGVRRWSKKLSDEVTKMNVNGNRNGNFSSSHNNPAEGNVPEGGWLSILRGK